MVTGPSSEFVFQAVGRIILSIVPAIPSTLLLALQSADPVLERLDPPRRAAVVMALMALVLTGLLLVTCAMLGGHWVRRLARHRPSGGVAGTGEDAAKNRQWRESLGPILPQDNTGDTIQLDTSSKETKIEPQP